MDELLTAEQVADVLGIKRRRVLVLAKDGRLPVARIIGQAQTFWRADVERFKATPRRPGRPRKKEGDE